MLESYYKDALRQGQKQAHSRILRGQSPCLPVLEDFLPPEKLASGTDLGLVQIPAEFIVGTRTRGRTNAFSPDFLPLLAEGSEFADKWERLCRDHLQVGIREPIRAWEYMNRYYVEEGNKRVSVLKYFGAPTVTGQVIRILPEKSDDPQTRLYFELISFYADSQVNCLEFSKAGSCVLLQKALGKAPGALWSEDERRRFLSVYYRFRSVYLACGGQRLQSTVGDALLACVQIYGWQIVSAAAEEDLKKQILAMWEEVQLQQEQPSIELKLTPEEEKKSSLLSRLLPQSEPALPKTAFLYDRTPELSGWAHGHELGRRYVQKVFEGALETRAYSNALDGDPDAVLEQAIADGNTLLFTTSPRLLRSSLRAAIAHPEVVIMNCTLNSSHRYIRTYYARLYEAKFILGAIAAALSDTGQIGYICDYPIFGQLAGINAFALGAQMVRPQARVHLRWSTLREDAQAEQSLRSKGIELISFQDTARFSPTNRSAFGLCRITDEDRAVLAAPVLHWGVYYETILRQLRSKSEQADYAASSKALNYYWGMSAGVVDLALSAQLPDGVRRLADYLRESIRREVCQPFLPPIRRQNGQPVGEPGQPLAPEQIINIDYLVENVVGSIPPYDALSPIAQATVDAVGLAPSAGEEAK